MCMARRLVLLAALILVGAGPAHGSSRPVGTLVFYSQRTVNGGLYAESATGGPLRSLRSQVESSGALWAPDGKHFLFQAVGDPAWESNLWISDANGRHARLLATNANQVSWAPDSRRIAFVRDGVVWTIRSDGGDARRVIAAQDPTGFVADPTWSPDGRRIAFRSASAPGGSGDSALMLVGATGGASRLLARCVYFAPSWSPKGDRIAFDSCGPNGRDPAAIGLYVQDVHSGARRRISRDTSGPISWSPNGKWIAFAVAGSALQVIRPDGDGLRKLFAADYSSTPAWAPDSRRLAFAYGRPSDIWVVRLEGRAQRVTQGWRYGYSNSSPSWQPRNLPPAQLGGSVVSPAIPTDSVVRNSVLEAARAVDALAADGRRVAIDYGAGPAPGPLIETWEPPTGAIVRFSTHGYQRPALAGDRLAVPQFSHAMGVNFFGLVLATVKRPNPLAVAGLCRPSDGPPGGPCIRDPLGDIIGHGSLLVFDSWKGPQPYCILPCPGPKREGRLYRIDAGAAVQIATSTLEMTPLAVDEDRILVNAGGGTLAVLDANGRTLATVAAPACTEAALQRTDLVAHRGVTLDDYDSASGALLHEWPIPADAVLEDVQNGVAAYVTSSDVHLLRLADGRDAVVTPPGGGPLHAQLETSGLFYSYAVSDAIRPGRVAFVPWAALPIRR